MAAAMMSMSESIQASIIIHHQLQQQIRQHPSMHGQQQQPPPPQPKGIAFYKQLALVSALFGIEMCVSFEQIYQILILQYLGVPLSMVSINGIACGGTSMVLLPVLGHYIDRGANPQLRKLFSLFVGMGMFLCGLALLTTCGFIKLASLGPIKNTTSLYNSTLTTSSTSSYNQSDETSAWVSTGETTPGLNLDSQDNSQLPATAFMSIAGFALIDIGFDMSVSLTRAFILEITPTFQHTRLLVMATVMASMAGTTFSFIGCFDFPGTLGALFQVEGVAATLIFFCSLLFCIIVIGYSLTAVTGLLINKTPRPADNKILEHKEISTQIASFRDTDTPRISRRRVIRSRSQKPLQQLYEDRPYVPDILHTEEGDPSTRPLLLDDSIKGNNYSAMTVSSSFLYPIKDAPEVDTPEEEMSNQQNIYTNTSFDNTSLVESNNIEAAEEAEADKPDCVSELEETGTPLYEHQYVDNGVSAVLAAIKQSYSMSMSVKQSPLGDFHTRKLEQLQGKKNAATKTAEPKIYFNKRLVILCISSFFTVGSSLGFIIYVSNTMNIGIFHGDPTAPAGSEGYELYEKGLRTAALGNLVLYSTYMLVSMNNSKIIDLIGEKLQFVLCHVLLLVTLLALLITERLEAYFVFMVFCGAFRTCAFTLPFVLANKFTLEENVKNNVDTSKPSGNLGRVMTLIGFLMPTHFIMMSTFMGPLMDATGNVWVPLIYSMCSCAISLVIFTSLFFIKS